jgi:intracellular sulfur oxidation DsrE/DsrF family protein
MKLQLPHWLLGLLCLPALLAAAPAAAVAESEAKPFAEHHIVLQISDADPSKQTLVLNVANNLIKAYGPDKVDVEIVAFGPGLRLLFAENVNSGRIDGLNGSGVRFAGCGNTLKKMTELLGEEPELHAKSTQVSAGVVRIVELVDQGYTLVKP